MYQENPDTLLGLWEHLNQPKGEKTVEEAERCFTNPMMGITGFTIKGFTINVPADDQYRRIYDPCLKHGVPVLNNVGYLRLRAGQPAYLRAARKSSGGTGIIAVTSQRPSGISNVVASIFDDSVVTRSRLDYDHGITKQGVAKLFSEDLGGQTETKLGVAPPETRDELARTEESFGLL